MVNGDAWIRLTALALGLTLTRVHVRLMRTAADLRLRTVLPDQRQSLPPSLAIHNPSPSPTNAAITNLPSQLPTLPPPPPPPPPLARAQQYSTAGSNTTATLPLKPSAASSTSPPPLAAANALCYAIAAPTSILHTNSITPNSTQTQPSSLLAAALSTTERASTRRIPLLPATTSLHTPPPPWQPPTSPSAAMIPPSASSPPRSSLSPFLR